MTKQVTIAVTIASFSNGSVHSPRINPETFHVTVDAGEHERGDAFNAAHTLYRAKHPDAIAPHVAAAEIVSRTPSTPEHMSKGEARVVRRLLRSLIAAGYSLALRDGSYGDGEIVARFEERLSVREMVSRMASTDSDTLLVRKGPKGEPIRTIVLVWGNSAEELIADHSTADDTLQAIIADASDYGATL